MPPTQEINLKTKVEIDSLAVVRPGDKLVIGAKRALSQQEADSWREFLEGKLPGVEVVITDRTDHMVVYKETRD